MFEDDDRPAKAEETFPRKLDALSIEALKVYIAELEGEIARVRGEIAKKEKLALDADSVFKS